MVTLFKMKRSDAFALAFLVVVFISWYRSVFAAVEQRLKGGISQIA